MGRLPDSPLEVRLAVTLFLLLLGLADLFGAWQVRNFAAFTPGAVAATVAPAVHREMAMPCCQPSAAKERPLDMATLDSPRHQINRDLLVQDTHVHVPVYTMTAGFLALIVFGLSLPQRARVVMIVLAFAAPFLDFLGLWGAHLYPARGTLFGTLTVGGGLAMGLVYLVVLILVLKQCWFPVKEGRILHA
jgi:hypothetical protein